MKMTLKKETKHTCVYETDSETAVVASVYVSKSWLRQQQAGVPGWPGMIELEVKVTA